MQYTATAASGYFARMADLPNELLRQALKANGFKSVAEAARHYGWEAKLDRTLSDIRHHFNGQRKPPKDAAERYAKDLGISRNKLLGLDEDDTPAGSIQVEGKAKWGEWLDTDFFSPKKKGRSIGVPRGLGRDMRRAVVVEDGSVDLVIREGDFAVYEPISPDEIADLTIAYLYIARRRGSLEERTVRKATRTPDGKLVLEPHSRDTRYAGTVTYPSSKPDEIIEILGKVVGQYGPL